MGLFPSGIRGSVRMRRRGCIITGSGIMIQRWDSIPRLIRLGWLVRILRFMGMYLILYLKLTLWG